MRFNLESFSPNLYGWLVWGGGFYLIRQAFKIGIVIAVIAAIFGAGYWAGSL